MASEPKDYTILYLTSNTEATENKVQFFNLAYRVKGFQCHSNNFLQQLGRKKTTSNCSAQCNPFHSQLASENLKSLIPD